MPTLPLIIICPKCDTSRQIHKLVGVLVTHPNVPVNTTNVPIVRPNNDKARADPMRSISQPAGNMPTVYTIRKAV